jgi:hypothetical protein
MAVELTDFVGVDAALERAVDREILPTALRSAELREEFAAAVRGRAVFSARTTNAVYLQELRTAIERLLEGGFGNDKAMIRLELKSLLQRLGYTPKLGFPGDQALGIPPAEPGELTDLSSDKRINLILDTQFSLMEGWAQQQRGEERADAFPAWELVRMEPRRVPRGSTNYSVGWVARWRTVGGPLRPGMRLMAPKGHPIWTALGDSAQFRDALDVTHPPFAFNSGMGWREVTRDEFSAWLRDPDLEAEMLGLGAEGRENRSTMAAATTPPEPLFSPAGVDEDVMDRLALEVMAKRARKSDALRYSELLTREAQAMRASYNDRRAAA